MPTSTDVLNVARSRLESDGSVETAWYGMPPGTNWCAIWVSYCLFHAGFTSLPGQTTSKGYAFVPFMEDQAKVGGLWRSGPPQPGWSVVYDWNGDQYADHVGLVEFVDVGGNVHTIEGNAPDHTTGGEIEVERHVIGPWGDRGFSTVLGYIAWPYAQGGPPLVPTLVPQYHPFPVASQVVSSYAVAGGGVRLLTDAGHVYEFNCGPHYGSPIEDPTSNWWVNNQQLRHGAKIQGNDKGGFTVWDTQGEAYHYGPQ